MRRIVRRRATVVTVQTWTVTWAEDVPEEDPAPGSSPALTAPALPSAPASEAQEPPSGTPRAAPDPADPAG